MTSCIKIKVISKLYIYIFTYTEMGKSEFTIVRVQNTVYFCIITY